MNAFGVRRERDCSMILKERIVDQCVDQIKPYKPHLTKININVTLSNCNNLGFEIKCRIILVYLSNVHRRNS